MRSGFTPPPRTVQRTAFYFVLVMVLGIVFWITYSGIQGVTAQAWTYSQLINQAQGGQVAKLEISGTQGVATDRNGGRHLVTLPSDTTATAKLLSSEDVQVVYHQQNSTASTLTVIFPNLLLVLLIGAFLWYVRRQARRGPPQPPG